MSDVKATRQHTGQKIHDNEVTSQTAERAGDVHTNCVRSITTSKCEDPVVNRGTGRVANIEHTDGLHACGESQ